MQASETNVTLKNGKSIAVHRVDNDSYGNPRFVIHYSNIADNYSDALRISRNIGGKRYMAKWYGGGIVFSTYNLESTLETLFDI